MPSLETIWKTSSSKTLWDCLKNHPIYTFIVLLVILSMVIFDNPVKHLTIEGWNVSNTLTVFTILVALLSFSVAGFSFCYGRKSAERTARMEMAKVVTEAFRHSEMFEAIDYFKKASPHLVDENGKDRKEYIELIQNAPETERHRYRILTTLRHAQRLYDKEKPDTNLFTSLITPDIVEVSLCLYKLDDYMKEVDKPIYEMVYKVFENIRTSYLEPYWDAKKVATKRLQHTRRILKVLQAWDRRWGDDGDRILTEFHLILLDVKEKKKVLTANAIDELIQRFQVFKREQPEGTNLSRFAELYFLNAEVEYEQGQDKYPSVIKNLTEAIELNSQYARAYYHRGTIKVKQEDYNGAIKDYDEVIKLYSNDAFVYTDRGDAKYNLKDYTGAIKDYNKAIELNPQYFKAYFNRAFAYQEMAQQAKDNGNEAEAEELEAKAQADFAEATRLRDSKQ
jgi:tetratricopeptide (TPR) repeat protein